MSGTCEDAIVGSANLCFHPMINQQFSCLGVLSSDGHCKPFDIKTNGYSRSETVTVAYFQKMKNAKRIYATCPHIKLNSDGYKEEGITYPSMLMQSTLLMEFYDECGIPKSCLDYIEAHGTGTIVGDPQEVSALQNVLCKNRETPLMIGSVKSNLGHAESAGGFGQIAKVLIAFETGIVPPNVNYTSPRKDIDALINGTVRVIEEPMPLKNGFVGINAFGFGGANAHMLLKWNPKQKVNNGATNDDLPRLVILSGRTKESVKLFLNDIASNPIDIEYIRLLHDVYADGIDGHPWRGFTILNTLQQDSMMEIRNCESMKRPVWFIFSALGSQWPGMGQNLLKFHVFANTIRQCDIILKPYGVNVTDILSKTDEKIYKNAFYAFVGIVAIQIGLVDVLTCLGITPSYIIGHSAGELGCAYADECLTIEQTILSAYFIGLACVKEKIICSSMALVSQFNYKSLKNICPSNVEIICRNSEDSSVVCGPTKSVQEFMKKLQLNNIHVKEIYCNVPYHSSYLMSVKNQLLLNLSKIIPRPKKRSSKWISSSVSCTEWYTSASNLSSAEYHTHSILNTVLFEQTTPLIPTNAVTIEIAPDSVLQHVLKKSLHPKVENIVLNRRNKQNIEVILQGIGKLYNCGLQLQVANIYPPVEFPVSRGTPMISPSIRWDHSEAWFTPTYHLQKYIKSRERYIKISFDKEDYDYMKGHVIDGRNLLPATGYIELVWQTIGMIKKKTYITMPIIFQDISFIRATHLLPDKSTNLTITIQKDGKFVITEKESVVVTGTVKETSNPEEEMTSTDILSDNNKEEHMTARDIYKKFKLRGYQYSGLFRGLHSASVTGNKGHITWKSNWTTFMDTMLQMYVIGNDDRNLYVPTSIQKLIINPKLHAWKLQDNKYVVNATTKDNDTLLPIQIYREIDTIISGGIEIRGLKAIQISSRKLVQDAVIEEHIFVAHHDRAKISLNEAIRISAQLVLEDYQITKVKAIELIEDVDEVASEQLSSSILLEAFSDIPLIQANITLLTTPSRFNPADLSKNILIGDLNKPSVNDKVLIVAGFNLLTKQKTSLERLLPFLREDGYVLTREKCNICDYSKYKQQYKLNVILEKCTDEELIVLMKKEVKTGKNIVVYINNDNFNWLDDLKLLVNSENKLDKKSRIILVGEADFECGLLGLVNCLRKEPDGELVRGVLIQDKNASKFSLQDPFYVQQLQKDMTINVLRPDSTWGSYRHLRLPRPEANPVPSAYICQMVPGDLSTFQWTENNVSVEFHPKDLIRVVYASLNFKDVMLATGKLKLNKAISREKLFQHIPLGFEYVGFDDNGNRVMGMRDTDCVANIVVKDKDLFWKIPDAWTFEEAATVPCIYSTSYMALYIYGKIKKGNKILIHSGTGGVGQAAIHLALKEGCEVFTTVGTNDKRNFIKGIFPTILDDHIGNSRDTSFEQMIMRHTNGRGVDIVLNSLAEEKLIASVHCLAQNGRFLEIGKFDLLSNNPLSIFAFKKGISFQTILLDKMFTSDHKYKSLLSKMVTDDLKNGTIKPIQAKIFLKTEIEQAFRYMASGKHMGKIIINIQDKSKPTNELIIAYRRYYCLKDKSYIIVGGLGGFGLELADWLIHRGARNIILISRTGIKNGYQRMKIQLWKKYGVNVLIVKNIDVADPKDCEYLLQTAEREAPVDAIYNLAVVLKDGILKNQTVDTFAESFQSKARVTQSLDKLSRKFCPKLRHFVVFSSVSCGRGNAGQTNYGMANSVMERVCEKRAEEGLPALAIQWGAVGDVGLVADMQEDDKELVISGTLQQKISSCLDELDKFLLQSRPVVSSMVVAEKKVGFSRYESPIKIIASILDIKDIKIVSQNTTLAELGMDSMTTVEIMQILERDFDIFLTTQEIRNLTFAKLNKMCSTNFNDDDKQDKENLDAEQSYELKFVTNVLRDEDFIPETYFDSSIKKQSTMTEVFIIPGVDGSAAVFKHLAPNIKYSITFLQYNTNNIDVTNIISETSDRLTNHILPKLRNGKDFVMVGYSFGSIIAIEITRRLETMNIKGRLVLIDGAPEQIQTMYKHITSDADLQIAVLDNIIRIYLSETNKKMLLELKKCNTWEERYNIFAKRFLDENTSLSPENLKTLCTTVYKYLSVFWHFDYSTLLLIKSPIILLKPTHSLYTSEIEEDYGLHKVTQNMVKVHYVEGNHVTILKNVKVSAVINGEPPFII